MLTRATWFYTVIIFSIYCCALSGFTAFRLHSIKSISLVLKFSIYAPSTLFLQRRWTNKTTMVRFGFRTQPPSNQWVVRVRAGPPAEGRSRWGAQQRDQEDTRKLSWHVWEISNTCDLIKLWLNYLWGQMETCWKKLQEDGKHIQICLFLHTIFEF